jgi:DNA-directed RNA polymerase alpha subunit
LQGCGIPFALVNRDVIQRTRHELVRPDKLQVTAGADPMRFATLVAEPLERGLGLTLGNALRRILLSPLSGVAVQSVQIDGVLHEFSSTSGAGEDAVGILANDKLTLSIATDGSVSPQDALTCAARILRDQLDAFAGSEKSRHEGSADKLPGTLDPIFRKKVDELDLSARTANRLKSNNIVCIGDLVHRTDAEMLEALNLGRKSLNEIKLALAEMALHLGTEVPGGPRERQDELPSPDPRTPAGGPVGSQHRD